MSSDIFLDLNSTAQSFLCFWQHSTPYSQKDLSNHISAIATADSMPMSIPTSAIMEGGTTTMAMGDGCKLSVSFRYLKPFNNANYIDVA
jgi:hypothetical protein